MSRFDSTRNKTKSTYVNVTAIGQKLHPPIFAAQVNTLLKDHGFQIKQGKNWMATSKGQQYSIKLQSTSRYDKYFHLKWSRQIIPILQNLIENPVHIISGIHT